MNNTKKSFIKGLALGLIITIISVFGVTLNAKTNLDSNGKALYIKSILDKYYMGEIDAAKLKDEAYEGAYKGMVDSLGDPYTVYFTKKEYSKFLEDTDGTFGGIGVVVSKNKSDNTIIILTVYENTPAGKANLMVGDKIIKVEDTSLTGDELDKAVDIMRGDIGTPVTITIYREAENKTFDVTMNRERIEAETISYKMLENEIGYIKMTGFEGVTYKQFKTAYDSLNEAGQKGLIIDLRFNPGGQLNIVEQIADLLVPEGPIVYIEEKGKSKQVSKVSDSSRIEIPLVLLVNNYSASASEVLTGAVKDYKVGKVVGTTTFGKGIVQTLMELGDGSGLKVTTAKYYTPNGVCIHGIGIEPDYVVEMPEDLKLKTNLNLEEDIQLQKAIQVINDDLK